MTHAALTPLVGPEFDDFLFACIGDEQNGTSLSVVSALARLNLDPWQEAVGLARMPRREASERLTALLASFPEGPAIGVSPGAVADRLIALLPQPTSFRVSAPQALVGVARTGKPWLFIALGAGVVVLAAYLILSTHQSTAPVPRADLSLGSDAAAPSR